MQITGKLLINLIMNTLITKAGRIISKGDWENKCERVKAWCELLRYHVLNVWRCEPIFNVVVRIPHMLLLFCLLPLPFGVS